MESNQRQTSFEQPSWLLEAAAMARDNKTLKTQIQALHPKSPLRRLVLNRFEGASLLDWCDLVNQCLFVSAAGILPIILRGRPPLLLHSS